MLRTGSIALTNGQSKDVITALNSTSGAAGVPTVFRERNVKYLHLQLDIVNTPLATVRVYPANIRNGGSGIYLNADHPFFILQDFVGLGVPFDFAVDNNSGQDATVNIVVIFKDEN